MKDLGGLKYFLGIEAARLARGVYLSQRKYVLDLLSETGMLDCKLADTPIVQNHHLAVYHDGTIDPRGVHAQSTVKCKELFNKEFPELHDSFTGKLLPVCATIRQVKESLLQRYQEVEQTAKEQVTDNAILDQPRQATMILNEQPVAYLSSAKAVHEYLEHKEENIMNLIKQNLAVGDIFECENLQFSTEELKEIEDSVGEFKRNKVNYDEEDCVNHQLLSVLLNC